MLRINILRRMFLSEEMRTGEVRAQKGKHQGQPKDLKINKGSEGEVPTLEEVG